MLTHDQQHIDHQQGQEARNFPYGLDEPHLGGIQVGDLHRKVIDEDLPGLESRCRRDRHEEEKPEHPPAVVFHLHREIPASSRLSACRALSKNYPQQGYMPSRERKDSRFKSRSSLNQIPREIKTYCPGNVPKGKVCDSTLPRFPTVSLDRISARVLEGGGKRLGPSDRSIISLERHGFSNNYKPL